MSEATKYKQLFKKYKAKCIDLKSKNCALEKELGGLYDDYDNVECDGINIKNSKKYDDFDHANEEAVGDIVEKSSVSTSFLPESCFWHTLQTSHHQCVEGSSRSW